MACRKRYAVELGKPRCAPGENQVGRRKAAICRRGVLSGIVLSGRESRPHGEGPDGRTKYPSKETRAGHVGLDKHEPTSLLGKATGSCNGQL